MNADRLDHETGILTGLKWVFFALGAICLVLFAFDPDIHAHPELVLLGGTGLLGSLSLKVLGVMLGPGSDIDFE